MSTKSAAPLSLELANSHWYAAYLFLLLTGGCVALAMLPLSPTTRIALVVVYLTVLSVWGWCRRQRAVRVLWLDAMGEGRLVRRGEEHAILTTNCQYYTPLLIVLEIQLQQGRMVLTLFRDQLDRESWRRLRRRFAQDSEP